MKKTDTEIIQKNQKNKTEIMNSFYLDENSDYYLVNNHDCDYCYNLSHSVNFADDYFHNFIVDHLFKYTFCLSSAQ